MFKVYFKLLVSIIVLLNLSSCEYDPSGLYERNIQNDSSPPQIHTIELNIESDSIFLYDNWIVRFSFSSNNQEIVSVRMLIDNVEQGRIYSDTGIFTVSPYFLSEGIHDLRIEIFTGSGTGSIADKLGSEGYVASHDWKLVVGSNFIPGIKTEIRNGFLHFSWTEYTGFDFVEYIVSRSNNYGEPELIHTTKTEFTDSTYAGEGGSYDFKIRIKDGGGYFPVGYVYLFPDLPAISYSTDSLNNCVLHWGKSRFYNAIDSVLIFQGTSEHSSSIVKATQDKDDTTYTISSNASFGDRIIARIRLVPKKPNPWYFPETYYKFESVTYPVIGYPFRCGQYIEDLHRISLDEFVYLIMSEYDTLVRYSVSGRRAIEKITYKSLDCYGGSFRNLMSSPAGKFVTSMMGCNQTLMLAASDNLASYSTNSDHSFFMGGPVHISDIGTGLLFDYNYDDLKYGYYMYDFVNSKVIDQYQRSIHMPVAGKISSDGKYFLVSGDSLRLVKFSDNLFSTVCSFGIYDNNIIYEFHPFIPDQIICWDKSVLSVRECENFSVIYEFPLTEDLLDIDYYNNEILTFEAGHLYIRSLQDGAMKYDLPVNFIPEWGSSCYLVDHAIVYAKGLIYFVK